MDFKEKYQKELENISASNELNQKIIETDNSTNKKTNYKLSYAKIVTATLLCVVVIGVAANFNTISTIAKSIFGTFKLSVGNQEFDFEEMETIEFNFEKFVEDGALLPNGTSLDSARYKHYYDYNECIEETELPVIYFKDITLDYISIFAERDQHYVYYDILGFFKGECFGFESRAATTGSTADSWGWGYDKEELLEIYEYTDGKKAYFITYDNDKPDDYTILIFFQEGNFFCKLSVGSKKSEEDAINYGKELLANIIR